MTVLAAEQTTQWGGYFVAFFLVLFVFAGLVLWREHRRRSK